MNILFLDFFQNTFANIFLFFRDIFSSQSQLNKAIDIYLKKKMMMGVFFIHGVKWGYAAAAGAEKMSIFPE